MGAETGSREPDPQAVPALTGFDPERTQGAMDAAAYEFAAEAEAAGLAAADEVIQLFGILPNDYMTRKVVRYAGRLGALQATKVFCSRAIAIEAAQAGETAKTGSTRSAKARVRKDIAQNAGQSVTKEGE